MKHSNQPVPLPSPCANARDAISARIDGEPNDALLLDAHLATCAACRVHARECAALRARFATLRAAAPTQDLWLRIEVRLAAGSAARAAGSIWMRLAAAVLGFAGTAWFIESLRLRERTLERSLAPIAESRAALTEVQAFAALPEHRLLAALQPILEEQR